MLGEPRASQFAAYYGVREPGEFEGRNILYVPRTLEAVAAEFGVQAPALASTLAEARSLLYAARAKRPAPALDAKVLAAWNGLAISALATGGFVLNEPRYLERAAGAAGFVLEQMRDPQGRLWRSHHRGRAAHAAVLEDYAFFIQGLLDLYETRFEARWLREARALQAELDAHFADAERGGYYFTRDDHEALLVRDKPVSDGALPSGNSVALHNLLRLSLLTGEAGYRERAERGFAAFASALARQYPMRMLSALDLYLDAAREVAIVLPDAGDDGRALLDALRGAFTPHRVLVVVRQGEVGALQAQIPWLRDKKALGGKATAYVCERGRCELPTTSPAQLLRNLR